MKLSTLIKQLAEDLNRNDEPTKAGRRKTHPTPVKVRPKERDEEPGLSTQQQSKLDRHLGKLSRMIKRGTLPRTDRPRRP